MNEPALQIDSYSQSPIAGKPRNWKKGFWIERRLVEHNPSATVQDQDMVTKICWVVSEEIEMMMTADNLNDRTAVAYVFMLHCTWLHRNVLVVMATVTEKVQILHKTRRQTFKVWCGL